MDYSHFTTQSNDASLQALSTTIQGLSKTEAQTRLVQYGYNEIKEREISWRDILVRQFTSPFVYLLLGAALLSFLLQDIINGVMIVLFILINASLGFYPILLVGLRARL